MAVRFLSVQSPAIGVIGGADGPTSIFVSTHDRWPLGALAAVCVVAAVGIVWFRRRRKLNRS